MAKGSTAHLDRGTNAETACCAYLQSRNLKLVNKNYRTRFGEIDLIMRDGKTLVFVEVRFRKNDHYGDGLASVTPAKQLKLRRAAEHFLQQNPRYKTARFDVVSMSENNQTSGSLKTAWGTTKKAGVNNYTFNWVTNAF